MQLTADIVSAYVSNNKVGFGRLGKLIEDVHAALKRAPNAAAAPEPEPREPAVPIRKSVTPDYIVSLEDGRKFKSLKRHLDEHLRPDAGRVPDEVGPAARLSDGRPELCQGAFRARQEHGPRPQARRRTRRRDEGARRQARTAAGAPVEATTPGRAPRPVYDNELGVERDLGALEEL